METPLRKPFGDATCSSAGKGQDLPGLPQRAGLRGIRISEYGRSPMPPIFKGCTGTRVGGNLQLFAISPLPRAERKQGQGFSPGKACGAQSKPDPGEKASAGCKGQQIIESRGAQREGKSRASLCHRLL